MRLGSGRAYYGKSATLSDYFDVVFWMGDLNYRIGVENDLCREFLRDHMYEVRLRGRASLGAESAGSVIRGAVSTPGAG